MILLCTVLEVVNGKSSFRLEHQSADEEWSGASDNRQHTRTIRHADILGNIPMLCPAGLGYANGRCRVVYSA